LAKDYWRKICSYSVVKIDYRRQFHQHFTSSFFLGKCFAPLSFNYSSALQFFLEKYYHAKAARKMLVQLTKGEDQKQTF